MPWKEPLSLKIRRRLWKPLYRILHSKRFFMTRYRGADFLLAPGGIGAFETSAKIFEDPELTHFIKRCRERCVEEFIDIGANIGIYSCIVLKSGAVPHAHLFEPDRTTLIQLRANLLMNRLLDRVTIHEKGVGDKNARLRLVPNWDGDNFSMVDSGFTRIVEDAPPSDRGYDVDVVRLDDALPFTGRSLAIKIDVERYECQVVGGMTRILRENRCVVQIEVVETRDDIIRMMAEARYALTVDFFPNLVFEPHGA